MGVWTCGGFGGLEGGGAGRQAGPLASTPGSRADLRAVRHTKRQGIPLVWCACVLARRGPPWHQQQQQQCVQAGQQYAGQHTPPKQQVEADGSACGHNTTHGMKPQGVS